MKTFEITFSNGERQIHEATYYRETIEAGTKVLELYKTVSNYDSQSKPYLFIPGYEEVYEVEEIPIIDNVVTLGVNSENFMHKNKWYQRVKDCCNNCKDGQECESKDFDKLFEKDELGIYINLDEFKK